MSSPTKKDVYHDPKGTNNGQRQSTRINKKQQGSQAKGIKTVNQKKSVSFKGSKMPEIVKLSSIIKDHKFKALHSSKKGFHTVIESHEDSDNSESKASSKVSFGGSPDLSSALEKMKKNMIDINEHQRPDHPSTFMKMINYERRQVLNPHVIWDGSID
jgi:hypothetical protein